MDEQRTVPDAPGTPWPGRSWGYALAVISLLAIHGGLTVQLFGREKPVRNLLNDEPITSGRHAVHLCQSGRAAARFDPSCYAGYPPTPVFDGESRPAQWFLRFGGDRSGSAAYKLGLAATYWLLPVGVWAATVALRLGRATCLAATGLGVLAAWSVPAMDLLGTGDVCIPFVGVSAVLALALLGRWHASPTPLTWLGLTAVGVAGWAAQPPLWLGVAALGMGCWAAVGRRHAWPWHVGLALAQAVALAASAPAWEEWVRDWWVRSSAAATSFAGASDQLVSSTVAPLRLVVTLVSGTALVVTSVVRLVRRSACRPWCPASGIMLAAGVTLTVEVISNRRGEPLPYSSAQLTVLGLWLAVLPAAQAVTGPLTSLAFGAARAHIGVIGGGGLFLAIAGVLTRTPLAGERPLWGPRPLAVGLPPDAQTLTEMLRRVTTPDARVLWEDVSGRPDLGWTVTLPQRLGRSFIGGMDPAGVMEHAACALRNGTLAGHSVAGWSDVELDAYCRRYNVGWIVCATDWAGDRFARWPAADVLPTPDGAGGWRVFVVRRPHSFVLKGHARQFQADDGRVTLTDVVPENGEVVLSLHFQEGWRVRPAGVRQERELDPYDPIPFVRLRMAGPAGRVTLSWDWP
jgi:hypothetical protein